MPESVILNPDSTWDAQIQDNMNPDYGFTRSRANTRAVTKPAGGRPWSREVTNTGHSFRLGWMNRSYLCAQQIKRFAEQYEDGYFTIVDWDGGGRHYVGRFTGEVSIVEAGNDRYNVDSVTFEEMPGVPMLSYPSDWDGDGVFLGMVNDFGDLAASLSGTWAQQNVVSAEGDVSIVLTNAGTVGAFATMQYRGYGFRLHLAAGPSFGQVQVQLDGTVVGTVDCYAPQVEGLQQLFEWGSVPLDLHRVKVVVQGSRNAASTGTSVTLGSIQVMR